MNLKTVSVQEIDTREMKKINGGLVPVAVFGIGVGVGAAITAITFFGSWITSELLSKPSKS